MESVPFKIASVSKSLTIQSCVSVPENKVQSHEGERRWEIVQMLWGCFHDSLHVIQCEYFEVTDAFVYHIWTDQCLQPVSLWLASLESNGTQRRTARHDQLISVATLYIICWRALTTATVLYVTIVCTGIHNVKRTWKWCFSVVAHFCILFRVHIKFRFESTPYINVLSYFITSDILIFFLSS